VSQSRTLRQDHRIWAPITFVAAYPLVSCRDFWHTVLPLSSFLLSKLLRENIHHSKTLLLITLFSTRETPWTTLVLYYSWISSPFVHTSDENCTKAAHDSDLLQFVQSPNHTSHTMTDLSLSTSSQLLDLAMPFGTLREKQCDNVQHMHSAILSLSHHGPCGKTTGKVDYNLKAIIFLSFLLIIITMLLWFSSFRKAFIVMLVISLSIYRIFIVFATRLVLK